MARGSRASARRSFSCARQHDRQPEGAAPLLLIVDAVLALGFIPNAWRSGQRRRADATRSTALALRQAFG